MHALRHCIHVPLQDEDNNITMQAVRVIMQAVRINQPPPTFNKLRKKKELLRSHTASPARHSFTSHGTASPATAQLHQPRHSFTSHGTAEPAMAQHHQHGTASPAMAQHHQHGTASPATAQHLPVLFSFLPRAGCATNKDNSLCLPRDCQSVKISSKSA